MAKQHEIEAKKAQLIDSYGPHGLAQMVIDLTAEVEELQEQLGPEWVQAGNGTLHGAIDHWQSECARLQSERDVLAAQAGRLIATRQIWADDTYIIDPEDVQDRIDKWDAVRNETPPAAMARVKAEAIWEACDDFERKSSARVISGMFRDYAQRLIDEAGE